jgi:hypothetical protein
MEYIQIFGIHTLLKMAALCSLSLFCLHLIEVKAPFILSMCCFKCSWRSFVLCRFVILMSRYGEVKDFE